jgi:hypothetical protein
MVDSYYMKNGYCRPCARSSGERQAPQEQVKTPVLDKQRRVEEAMATRQGI